MESLTPDQEEEELTGDEILKLNKIRNRYSRKEINEFILERMEGGRLEVKAGTYLRRRISKNWFSPMTTRSERTALTGSGKRRQKMVDNGRFRYPGLIFERKGQFQKAQLILTTTRPPRETQKHIWFLFSLSLSLRYHYPLACHSSLMI